ncbi:MAG: AraC family transcriptional regulator [Clostridia bacterium]|nr:AraC family transcriptional regulator [Clostridia bacterium]
MPNKSLPFSAGLIGVSFCTGKYRIRRKKSPYTVVEYVTDGEGCVMTEEGFQTVGKDRIYICPAEAPHDYYSSADRPWVKIWMNIRGRVPLALLREYGLSGTVIADGKPLRPLFEQLRALVYSEKTNDECQDEILVLFIKIINGLYLIRKQKTQDAEAVEMKLFLDANTHRLVGNAELSAHVYRSPDYCVKLFRREYGTTPYNYQLLQKMTIAQQMLAQTDIPISKLSEALGYSDPHYFSGLFKQKCGMSPKDYRKASKAANE